jgi:hypothetical protein
MSSARGHLSYLAFAEEAVYGIPFEGAYTQLPINSESLQDDIELIEENRIHYLTPVSETYNPAEKTVSGSVVLNFAVSSSLQLLLRHTLGGTITDYDDSVALVISDSGQDPLPVSLSFEKAVLGGSTSVYTRFIGCRVDSFALHIPQEGILTGTWNFKGKDSATKATPYSSSVEDATSLKPFIGCDFTLSLESGQVISTREVSLTLSNNLVDSDLRVGQSVITSLRDGARQIKGSLTCLFEDSALYLAVLNQSVLANVLLSFKSPFGHIYWQTKRMRFYGKGSPIVSGSGIITASFDFLLDLRGNVITFIDGADIVTLGTGEPVTLGSGETVTT